MGGRTWGQGFGLEPEPELEPWDFCFCDVLACLLLVVASYYDGERGVVIVIIIRSGITNTPRGGVVNCAQAKSPGIPFRSQRTPCAHPSPLWIGVPSSSWTVALYIGSYDLCRGGDVYFEGSPIGDFFPQALTVGAQV